LAPPPLAIPALTLATSSLLASRLDIILASSEPRLDTGLSSIVSEVWDYRISLAYQLPESVAISSKMASHHY